MEKVVITPLGTVSPYCYKDKKCSGFMIEYENQKYLIDAGNGITANMSLPTNLDNLKIIISHLHPDHYGELNAICQAALVYKKLGLIQNNIEIYIPSEDTNEVGDHILDYYYIHHLEREYPVKIIDYNYLQLKSNDLEITTIKVPHSIVSNAIKIKTDIGTIVYSGDTGTQNELREFARYANLFICESTYLQGQVRMQDMHLYASDAGKIARDAKVNQLLLTHFWPHISKNIYVNEAKDYFYDTNYAEEGKKLVLK